MSKIKALMGLIRPLLANDEKAEEVEKKVEEIIKDEDDDKKKANDELTEEEKKKLAEDEEEEKAKKLADDEAEEEKKEKMANDSKLAMDAAIKGVEARFTALRQAEREVRPIVGDLACDSAEEVYRTALKQMGCEDHASLPAATLSAVFKAYSRPAMAQDSNPIQASSRENVLEFFEGKK